jgi:transcription elongation factor Elf1
MINHYLTENITCPWCGFAEEDSCELIRDSHLMMGKMSCRHCGKQFKWAANFEVSYITEKVEDCS